MEPKPKKKKTYKTKTGRPSSFIEWPKVEGYLKAQCTGTSIAGLLGIHPDTLYRECKRIYGVTFSEYSRTKKAEGLELLRAAQFQGAMGGNTIMQIWLGKQYLGQKDKAYLEPGDQPLNVNVKVTSKENEKKLKDFLNGGESK